MYALVRLRNLSEDSRFQSLRLGFRSLCILLTFICVFFSGAFPECTHALAHKVIGQTCVDSIQTNDVAVGFSNQKQIQVKSSNCWLKSLFALSLTGSISIPLRETIQLRIVESLQPVLFSKNEFSISLNRNWHSPRGPPAFN